MRSSAIGLVVNLLLGVGKLAAGLAGLAILVSSYTALPRTYALMFAPMPAIFGTVVTAGYALTRDWAVVVPAVAWAGGLGAAMVIGAIAGLVPALRAARLSPTEALRTV